jgi:hypothetical protein
MLLARSARSACFLAIALALVASEAHARKECRPVGTPAEAEAAAAADGTSEASAVAWARGNDSSWVHAADPSWVHAAEREAHARDLDSVAYDPNEGTGWVHETDYGWWAGSPDDAALNELDDEDPTVEEHCTVSRDRNECVVLANQIANYRFRLGLAREREDELWAGSLEATIERLEARGERRGCPWVEPSIQEQIQQTVEVVLEAAGVAAQAAAMFYRMGLF